MSISLHAAYPQEQEALPHLTPDEVRLYRQAYNVIDWSPAEIRSRPELKNLQPGESQHDLPMILQKVGERVAVLFDKLPDTTSTEEVRFNSRFFGPQFTSGNISRRYFRYLLLVHPGQDAPVLDEYRTTLLESPGGGQVEPRGGTVGRPVDFDQLGHAPMLASRFIATVLNFHPQKQATCRFRYFGRQMLDERESVVVAFAQIPEANPEATVLRFPDKRVEPLVQGLAWFDAASYEILRIQTDLLAPRPDLGLSNVTIKIDFRPTHIGPVQLVRRDETPATFQLPTRAVVDATLFGQKFRNIHDYSDYQLFRVESRIAPSNQSVLTPAPGGGPAPSIVTPQPMEHTDPWYPVLLSMYRKSQSKGELIRNSDQEWLGSLGLTDKQLNTVREVTRRLDAELREIDAKQKTIIDAERAAHPPAPELKALHQQYDELIEREVANLKKTLGPDLTARLNIYIQAQEARAAAHHPGSSPPATLNPRMDSSHGYSSFFISVSSNDRAAIDREELDDEDGTDLRNRIRNNLGFSDEQFEPIRVTAQRLEAEQKEYFVKLMAIRDPYSAASLTSPDLKTLDQLREATIDTEISYLRRTLHPDGCARLDGYFRVHYGL